MSFLSDNSLIEKCVSADELYDKMIKEDSITLSHKSLKQFVVEAISSYLEENGVIEKIFSINVSKDDCFRYIYLLDKYGGKIHGRKQFIM